MPPTPTHCPYCALQCGMVVDTGTVTPREDVPANEGGALCQKGWTAAELLCASDRVTVPLMRAHRDAPFETVSWDAALDRIVAEVRRVQERYGRDAVAVFGGGGLTNEKAYQLGKFARVALRTANIDYNGRFCMSSAAAAQTRAFGLDRPGPGRAAGRQAGLGATGRLRARPCRGRRHPALRLRRLPAGRVGSLARPVLGPTKLLS